MSSIPSPTHSAAAEKTAVLEMLTYLEFDSKSDEILTIDDIIESANSMLNSGACENSEDQ